jgi:hypothetical protein
MSPSSGERSRFLAVLTLTVYQGPRKCDHDGYSDTLRYHSGGSKQPLQGRECPNKELITTLNLLLVWCQSRGAAENSGDGSRYNGRILLQSK